MRRCNAGWRVEKSATQTLMQSGRKGGGVGANRVAAHTYK